MQTIHWWRLIENCEENLDSNKVHANSSTTTKKARDNPVTVVLFKNVNHWLNSILIDQQKLVHDYKVEGR